MIQIEACKTCTDPCCARTTYKLTNEDIERYPLIIHATKKNTDGTIQLRAPCFFLDHYSNKCNIYNNRPLGCRIYPIVYNNGPSVDTACPGHTEAPDPITKTIILEHYMHTIEREAKERLE